MITSMKSFDTSRHPYKFFNAGYVNASEIAETLAELDLGLEFHSTDIAKTKLEFHQRHGNDVQAEIDRLIRSRRVEAVRIGIAMEDPNLEAALQHLKKRSRAWRLSMAKVASACKWEVQNQNGTPLMEAVGTFRKPILVQVQDVIDWLYNSNHEDFASALEVKRDLTIRLIARKAGVKAKKTEDTPPTVNWPWGRHNTRLLEVLLATAQKFWARYDPLDESTHKLKEEVVGWIMKRYAGQVSLHMANAIATILRADGLRTGRPNKQDDEEILKRV